MTVLEACWLRSKSYGLRVLGLVKRNIIISTLINEIRKNKSINNEVMKTHITIDDYLEMLLAVANPQKLNRKLLVHQNLMKSRKLHIQNISQQKVCLAGFDIKRLIMSDNITTKPLGYLGDNMF